MNEDTVKSISTVNLISDNNTSSEEEFLSKLSFNLDNR